MSAHAPGTGGDRLEYILRSTHHAVHLGRGGPVCDNGCGEYPCVTIREFEAREAARADLLLAAQHALAAMVEWYVQDQVDVIGVDQARAAAFRECGAIRNLQAAIQKAEGR